MGRAVWLPFQSTRPAPDSPRSSGNHSRPTDASGQPPDPCAIGSNNSDVDAPASPIGSHGIREQHDLASIRGRDRSSVGALIEEVPSGSGESGVSRSGFN